MFLCYQSDNQQKGCGLLPDECKNTYHASQASNEDPNAEWRSNDYLDSAETTRELFIQCTGYDPENDPDSGDIVSNPNLNLENNICRRLCCENLLFPVGSSSEEPNNVSSDIVDENDRKIYKNYLKKLYNNNKASNSIGYIESDYPILSGQIL